MRVRIDAPLGHWNAYKAKHLDGAVAGFCARRFLMQSDAFHDLVANSVHGRERGHGFLENHGDVAAADGAHFAAAGAEVRNLDGLPLTIPRREPDRACDDLAAGREDPEHGAGRDAFSAPTLADHAERPISGDVHIHAVHGMYGSLLQVEPDIKPSYLDQVLQRLLRRFRARRAMEIISLISGCTGRRRRAGRRRGN